MRHTEKSASERVCGLHSRRNGGVFLCVLNVDAGDAHDPDQASGGSSDGGDGDDDGGDDVEDGGEGDMSSSKRIVTSFNLDDVSSSEEEGDGEEDEDAGDDESDDDGGGLPTKKAKKANEGAAGKRVHWGEEGDDEDYHEGVGSKRQRQTQANVFAGVSAEGADTDASMEEQMRQLDQQDEKAQRAGGGVAGQAELRRAREALRWAVDD